MPSIIAISLAFFLSKAALKTGCGLVTVFVPKCGYTVIQTAIPEIMVLTDVEDKYISEIIFAIKPQAIGIGPGMGQELETQNALINFLKQNSIPLVVDADALNILSINNTLLKDLPPQTILTPHLKELERLIGKWDSESEKIEKTIAFSKKYQLLKRSMRDSYIMISNIANILLDYEKNYDLCRLERYKREEF